MLSDFAARYINHASLHLALRLFADFLPLSFLLLRSHFVPKNSHFQFFCIFAGGLVAEVPPLVRR